MIATDRLILRAWREADVAPFHAMGQDTDVMRYIGAPPSVADAQAAHDRMVRFQTRNGYCFWAIERKADAAFVGFCGLKPGEDVLAGQTEIAWRLRRDAWGQGHAREAAEASLAWGWARLEMPSITAITVPANTRSRGLMGRLGMVRVAGGDFDHPAVLADSPLRRHIRYRIDRPAP